MSYVRAVIAVAVLVSAILLSGPTGTAGAQEARVEVVMTGADDGVTTRDDLRVVGTDGTDVLSIMDGEDCDGRTCRLEVVSGGAKIVAREACRSFNPRHVSCLYFRDVSGAKTGEIDLRGGADSLAIAQQPHGGETMRWRWRIHYGAGDDFIPGSVLQLPADTAPFGLFRVEIFGDEGNDRFSGTFTDRRPITLHGDDSRTVVGVADGADVFSDIAGGSGMEIRGDGGNDSARTLVHALVEGGEGNDVLNVDTGGPGASRLDGGNGVDVVSGGPGADDLRGGAGGDFLSPEGGTDTVDAGAGNDRLTLMGALDGLAETFDGGDGADRVVYGAATPVTVHLDGSQASTGGDVLRGFEDVTGSSAPDRLLGNAADNDLDAGTGRGDHVEGRGGDDVIDVDDGAIGGGVPDDTASGGSGADVIRANDGLRDTVSCGSSTFLETVVIGGRTFRLLRNHADLATVDLTDPDPGDCEQLDRQAIDVAPAATLAGHRLVATPTGRVRVTLRCPARAVPRCLGVTSIALIGRSAPLADRTARSARRYRIRAGGRRSVVLRLTAADLRRLRTRPAEARVTTIERDANGRDVVAHRTAVVRLRR